MTSLNRTEKDCLQRFPYPFPGNRPPVMCSGGRQSARQISALVETNNKATSRGGRVGRCEGQEYNTHRHKRTTHNPWGPRTNTVSHKNVVPPCGNRSVGVPWRCDKHRLAGGRGGPRPTPRTEEREGRRANGKGRRPRKSTRFRLAAGGRC